MILAADVGGTKTHIALFKEERPLICTQEKNYVSRNYPSLLSIVEDFLHLYPLAITHACFAIAGPIQENKVRTTNLPWEIDALDFCKKLGIDSVYLLNDLQANAWGIRTLSEDKLYTLHKADPIEGNQALISAGTGLGQSGLFWNGASYFPFACEGGHCDFSPRCEREVFLLTYLKKKYGHVSWERVVSGMGILELYEYLLYANKAKSSFVIKEVKDPVSIIAKKALEKEDPLCVEALHWFVSLYGAESGNVALKFMALSGVYIGGGIAPKILDLLKSETLEKVPSFFESFRSKGRMEKLLCNIPIKVILEEKTALLGAAEYVQHLKNRIENEKFRK